jgi:hypothetical protein
VLLKRALGTWYWTLATILGCITLLAACSDPSPSVDSGSLIELDFDRDEPKPFVEFYLGPYAVLDSTPTGQTEIYDSGLVVEDEGTFYLDLARLVAMFPAAVSLQAPAEDGVLDWDELKPFLNEHYYNVVDAPSSLADFMSGFHADTTWMEIEVNGVMSRALRHVLIQEPAVRAALEKYRENEHQLLYPVGTQIVADHTIDTRIKETTAMRKRADGLWDFFVFDSAGNLTDSTSTPPKSLKVPTQCAGCHLGTRLYEPEKSFPGAAPPGPEGERAIHVEESLKNPTVVRLLDEHRKRSDGILGLYGTIYLSKLVEARAHGDLSVDDAALLDAFGL